MIWVLFVFFAPVPFLKASEQGTSYGRTCRSVVEGLLTNPPPHTAVSHCCNFSKVIYECINGYKLVGGDRVVRCSGGRLNGTQPKCQFPRVKSCGNPGTIRRGFFIGSSFNVGDTVEYRCAHGFKILGSSISKCKPHGTWTARPKCVDENVMDVNEATAFIRHSLSSKVSSQYCSMNGTCSRAHPKTRRSLDLDFNDGLDLVFLFDGSSAVAKEDFKIGLRFAQELVRVLSVTLVRGDVRVSAVSYNSKPSTVLNFAFPSEKVIKSIGTIKKPGGCGTSLGRAMYMTRRRVVPNTRTNSNKAMFIVTSGLLNIGTSHPKAARLLESESSFQIFTIAIGKNPNKRILTSVASQPTKSHVIFLRYHGDVFDAVRRTVTVKDRDLSDCGVSVTKPKARNVRGNKAISGIWPWHVNIYWDDVPICSGALIGQEWVITAAHCFYSKTWRPIIRPASRYIIKAGGHHLGLRKTSPEQVVEADKIHIHHNYNRHTHENDIGLVKLQRKMKLGKYVRPVCMPRKEGQRADDLAVPGQHGYVAGWGEKQIQLKQSSKSSKRRKGRSKVVVHVALAVSPDAICKNSTSQTFNSTVMFCAGDEKAGQHSCRGDGGGPFVRERYDPKSKVYRWTVAGLVSWGEGCGVKGRFSYFTRVAPYFDWISLVQNSKKKSEKKRRRKRLNRRNNES